MKLLSGVHRYRRTLNTLNPLPSLASEKKCIREYIYIRIRHPVFAIRIVFVTCCIRSSPSRD